ncbi:PaaI family thioesterase [Paracoccus cavernae]|uniref:PaaI family thioesterase n=1 Tax=Paracoccus cavernae TaxID=1571207 RepID=A0ABT8D7J6_9RHOB|nr:PaaI family thioesterase [Paracoccus cavernae]
MIDRSEPLHQIKSRRDMALQTIVGVIPYAAWLGISFDRRGDELTAVMAYAERNIGNPLLPALHGGAIAAFLETAAVVQLAWARSWDDIEGGRSQSEGTRPASSMPVGGGDEALRLPKTIDFTVDYLRSGLPRDAYARARIVRSGRRYASVQVEAWQDNRERLFAQATGHFLMPSEG